MPDDGSFNRDIKVSVLLTLMSKLALLFVIIFNDIEYSKLVRLSMLCLTKIQQNSHNRSLFHYFLLSLIVLNLFLISSISLSIQTKNPTFLKTRPHAHKRYGVTAAVFGW